ncbi:hypothetical protein MKW98_002946 [Papaver atlanticum]|uniref:Uncharacterized protein n=1 Tax=Papaver atlanticum TaxID=357466 RepID=A0AAD4XPR8_9MAGN|nr:hypothetical protein MKW98_002946 [Papaver atlanticum]
MFLLIGLNLLTTITAAAKDENELDIKMMNIDISRKLLIVKEYKLHSPIPNPSVRWPPPLK